MTFTIKHSGAGGFVMAEYRCPEHGVFEVTAPRNENGDAPDTSACPESCLSYEDDQPTTCSYPSPWTISAPKPKVWTVTPTAVVRGGDMRDRPPGMLDTRPLAEGMKYSEWKNIQRNEQRTRRHKMLVDKGVISKKIQVG